jgi:plastocyanin
MKPSVISLIMIAGFLAILYLPSTAYSDFISSDNYLIQATGFVAGTQNILDSTFDIQLTAGTQSGSSILSTLDNGLVTINGDNYLNSGNWTTTLLRDGKFLLLKGNAQDQSGNTIQINLFGRQIQSNQDGVVYSITGKIISSETFRVIYSAKIITAGTYTPPVTSPTSQTTPTLQNQTQSIVRISIVAGASSPTNQLFFSPSVVTVAPGTTIIWTNNDNVPHRIMSGVASVNGGNPSTPTFTSDGKIDSGIIAPGKSFQYTITYFDPKTYLSAAAAQYLNLLPDQTTGDITFFDPNYTWMIGVISPTSALTPTQTVQINILPGASTATSNQYLTPSSVQVTPGSTIVWVNQDSVAHRIVSGQQKSITNGCKGTAVCILAPSFTPDGMIDTGIIAPGQTLKSTITGTGVFTFYDPSNTWINGNILSVSQISSMPPVQVSILPESSSARGSASQQNQNYVNRYYSLDHIQIVPGTTVIWTNNDSIAHSIWSGTATLSTVNPYIPDGKIKSGPIAPGQSFQVVINSTGIIRFYDPSYTWMNGIIVSIPSSTQTHIINSGVYQGPTPSLH